MNNFLKGFFSLFDWMSPKSLDDSLYDLDISMMELYDRMGWGSYSNALKNIYVLSPDMKIVSLEKDMKNTLSNNSNISTTSTPSDIGNITITTSQTFLDEMIKLVPSGCFQPYAYYNADMDAIQVYFKDKSSYTEPLNNNLELYLCHDTDEIVGAKILRVKSLLNGKDYSK